MLLFDPDLKQALDAAPNKTRWTEVLKSYLGPTRVLRCKHDAAAGADPWATGIEFSSINMTGALQVTAGNISDFGVAISTN